MRVSIVRGGGIGGMVRATTADTNRLSPEDGDELKSLVRRAGLLEAQPAPDPGEPEPDRFTYAVSIEDGGRCREARFSDRSLTEPVRSLIAWVRTVDGHEESIAPP